MSRKPTSHDGHLSPARCAELDRRLEEFERDPDGGEPWEVVHAEILRDLERDRVLADTSGYDPGEDPDQLTPAHCAELDRRLKEDDLDPEGGIPWEVMREELLRRVAHRRTSTA